MLPGILEIISCIIAAVFGIIGFFYGIFTNEIYIVSVSGALILTVVVYLSQLAEVMQKPDKFNIIVCKVLNKSIYVMIIVQVITAALMVK